MLLTRSRTETATQPRIPKNDSTLASLCTSVYFIYTPCYENLWRACQIKPIKSVKWVDYNKSLSCFFDCL